MRLHLILAATTLFAIQPADAGVRAQYRLGQGPDQRLMTVEVNDHGDGRADMGDGRIMLLLGGIAYVVEADARGSYLVRLEDAEFENEVTIADGRRPAHGPMRPPATSVQRVRLVRVGTEIVAHHRGTLWRIVKPAAPAGGGDDYVVSDDPRLAPLNLMVSPQGPAAPARILDPTGAAAARWAIYRRGAILREGHHLLLQRAEVRPIPEPFVLPGPILTREAYSARRRSSTRD
jgi:hypothetical protein